MSDGTVEKIVENFKNIFHDVNYGFCFMELLSLNIAKKRKLKPVSQSEKD